MRQLLLHTGARIYFWTSQMWEPFFPPKETGQKKAASDSAHILPIQFPPLLQQNLTVVFALQWKTTLLSWEPTRRLGLYGVTVTSLSTSPDPAFDSADDIHAAGNNALYQVCMMSTMDGYFWVSCDLWGKLWPFERLPTSAQFEVDLSLVTATVWHCR